MRQAAFAWLGIAIAGGIAQTAGPQFRTGESATPPAGEELALIPEAPQMTPPIAPMPRMPQVRARGTEVTLLPEMLPARVVARPPERPDVPLALQRRPFRNLSPSRDHPIYTLRTPSGLDTTVTLSAGTQIEIRYSDNVNAAPSGRDLSDWIIDVTPIVQLNIGDPPGRRTERWRESEFYFELLYAPTEHWLLKQPDSRWLHRVVAEVGRVNPISRSGVRLDYDENLFSSSSDTSAEESYTTLEVSPFVEYNPSAKTSAYVRGTYRRIKLELGLANRSDYVITTGVDVETSVKTTVGAGIELAHLNFMRHDFGTQEYEQAFLSWAWKATPKVTFRARGGVEFRQFHDRALPKDDRVSPIGVATISWLPDERTRLNLGFRVRNQPSVIEQGALFQEVRFGIDGEHSFGENFYARGEVEVVNRNYDTGRDEREVTLRPAVGWRTVSSRAFDSMNVELFYQYRHRRANSPELKYERNQVGIQTTVYF